MPEQLVGDERPSLQVVQHDLNLLREDFYEHAKTVNAHIEVVVKFIAGFEAAKQEREKIAATERAKSELTWSKVMAIGGIIGAFNLAPLLLHLFHG